MEARDHSPHTPRPRVGLGIHTGHCPMGLQWVRGLQGTSPWGYQRHYPLREEGGQGGIHAGRCPTWPQESLHQCGGGTHRALGRGSGPSKAAWHGPPAPPQLPGWGWRSSGLPCAPPVVCPSRLAQDWRSTREGAGLLTSCRSGVSQYGGRWGVIYCPHRPRPLTSGLRCSLPRASSTLFAAPSSEGKKKAATRKPPNREPEEPPQSPAQTAQEAALSCLPPQAPAC